MAGGDEILRCAQDDSFGFIGIGLNPSPA